jgi:hypothetical protein
LENRFAVERIKLNQLVFRSSLDELMVSGFENLRWLGLGVIDKVNKALPAPRQSSVPVVAQGPCEIKPDKSTEDDVPAKEYS